MTTDSNYRYVFRSDVDPDELPEKRKVCARLLMQYYTPEGNHNSLADIADKAESQLGHRPNKSTVSRAQDSLKKVHIRELDEDPLHPDHPIHQPINPESELQAMHEWLQDDGGNYDARSFVTGWIARAKWNSNEVPP